MVSRHSAPSGEFHPHAQRDTLRHGAQRRVGQRLGRLRQRRQPGKPGRIGTAAEQVELEPGQLRQRRLGALFRARRRARAAPILLHREQRGDTAGRDDARGRIGLRAGQREAATRPRPSRRRRHAAQAADPVHPASSAASRHPLPRRRQILPAQGSAARAPPGAAALARRLPISPRGAWPREMECTVADIPCPRMSGAWRALLALLLLLAAIPAAAQVRIKDIADVEGVRDNQLVGYGLVVGLNGTGDRLRSAVFTRQSLIGVLERLGVNTRDQEQRLDTRNVAAVMVTANLPPFARPGSRIDIAVSTLGDATNITGGTLLVTPLLGADGEVYAVAQGSVATGAIAARGAAASVTRGVPTAGRIANGAVVEREVAYQFARTPQIRLSLRNPDLTTARRMAEAINRHARGNVAQANDPRTVTIALAGRDPVGFLTEIEQLRVQPDQVARVVIEEASGTIVMGANVRVSTVAIAQGNLTIRITETPQVAQPNPLAGGETVVVPRTGIEVDDQSERRMGILNGGVTLAELVRGLNSLGVGPRDLITILQTIKAAGALQAELEIR